MITWLWQFLAKLQIPTPKHESQFQSWRLSDLPPEVTFVIVPPRHCKKVVSNLLTDRHTQFQAIAAEDSCPKPKHYVALSELTKICCTFRGAQLDLSSTWLFWRRSQWVTLLRTSWISYTSMQVSLNWNLRLRRSSIFKGKLKTYLRKWTRLKFGSDLTTHFILSLTKVFVDGTWVGFTKSPAELVDRFKEARRMFRLSPYVSICWQPCDNAIEIRADAGRLCRPVLVVKEDSLLFKRRHMRNLRSGIWGYNFQ